MSRILLNQFGLIALITLAPTVLKSSIDNIHYLACLLVYSTYKLQPGDSHSFMDVMYFPKWQLPKGIFPSGKLLNVQCSNRPLPKPFLAAPLCPPPQCSRWRSNLSFGKLPLGKLHIWEVGTWQIAHWEVTLGKCLLDNTIVYRGPK